MEKPEVWSQVSDTVKNKFVDQQIARQNVMDYVREYQAVAKGIGAVDRTRLASSEMNRLDQIESGLAAAIKEAQALGAYDNGVERLTKAMTGTDSALVSRRAELIGQFGGDMAKQAARNASALGLRIDPRLSKDLSAANAKTDSALRPK